MIILRKPLVLYDADAVGLGVVALLLGVAWVGVAQPLMQSVSDEAAVRSAIAAAESARATERANVLRITKQIERLDEVVREQSALVPGESARNSVVTDIVSRAERHGISVVSLTPVAPVRGDRYVTADTELIVRCPLAALIALLDELARDVPFHSVEDLNVSEDRKAENDECLVSLRLRLFMFIEGAASRPAADGGRK